MISSALIPRRLRPSEIASLKPLMKTSNPTPRPVWL